MSKLTTDSKQGKPSTLSHVAICHQKENLVGKICLRTQAFVLVMSFETLHFVFEVPPVTFFVQILFQLKTTLLECFTVSVCYHCCRETLTFAFWSASYEHVLTKTYSNGYHKSSSWYPRILAFTSLVVCILELGSVLSPITSLIGKTEL